MWARLTLALLLGLWSGPALAQFEVEQADFVWSQSWQPPADGWRAEPLPFTEFFLVRNAGNVGVDTRWARFVFVHDTRGEGPFGLTMNYTSERYTVFLNGQRIYRNYIEKSERTFANFGPAYVDLPPALLVPGRNLVHVRLESDEISALGLGRVHVGPAVAVRAIYDRYRFLQFDGPRLVNAINAALTVCLFLFWFKRRQETASFWLALTGLMWWARNLHYSAVAPVVGGFWMWEIAFTVLFMIHSVYFAYLSSFLGFHRRKLWTAVFFGLGLAMVALRQVLLFMQLPDLPAYLLMVPIAASIPLIVAIAVWRDPSLENMALLFGALIGIAFPVHDFGYLAATWRGAGFALMPYASVIVTGTFIFALGRRFLIALDDTEDINATLALRVDDARSQLAASEAARQSLAVEHALTEERSRLMSEIHDRVGSSLMSAITVSERQGGSRDMVLSLRRSLQDMKLAVDSLDDLGGNVAYLLGTFRHRIEPDLYASGMRFDWRVQEVPDIAWLDAVNALHVLRILQECVANTLAHSGAKAITLGCMAQEHEDRPGVVVSYEDDGCGFDPITLPPGHGLRAIRARAGAISAKVWWEGSRMLLWLPMTR